MPARGRGRRGRSPAESRRDRPCVPGRACLAPSSAQGQAGHLPVHERRAVAARSVRLQADPEPDERQGPARLGPDGPAADRHVVQPGDLAAGRLDLQVRPAWRVGHLGQRALAAYGQDGRRPLLHPLRLHRGDQPRPGDHLLPDRLADRRAAVDGVLAELRPGLG